MASTAAGAATGGPGREQHVKKQRDLRSKDLFRKDLKSMMYGFGDPGPAVDTVELMEELLIEHITDVCLQAHRMSSSRRKIKVDDFRFALRKDPKKLARVDELLAMEKAIAQARSLSDWSTYMPEVSKEDQAAAVADAAAMAAAGGGDKGGAAAADGTVEQGPAKKQKVTAK